MKILQNKWTSFACCCLNFIFALECYTQGSWVMFGVCTGFMLLCGYNFWTQMAVEEHGR